MQDIWKVWRVVSPLEGLIGMAIAGFLATFLVHYAVLFGGTGRYITALVG